MITDKNLRYVEQYFELDLPYCALDFGIGDCNGDDNDAYIERGVGYECFNCKTSCLADYGIFEDNLTTKTIRFVTNTLNHSLDAIPILNNVSVNGQKIFPGQQLSARERISFKLNNIVGEDHWFDKNIITSDLRAQRAYTVPFLARFNARYPDLKGISARYKVIEFFDDGTSDLSTTSYIVDSSMYDGSTMSIDALDVLSLLDDDQFKYPTPYVSSTDGLPLTIVNEVPASSSTFDFDLPFYLTLPDDGYGNTNEVEQYLQQYEIPGIPSPYNENELTIGSEIVAYTRTSALEVSPPFGDPIGYVTISVTQRGLYSSKVSNIPVGASCIPVARLGYGDIADIPSTVLTDLIPQLPDDFVDDDLTPFVHIGPKTAGKMFAYLCRLADTQSGVLQNTLVDRIKRDYYASELVASNCDFLLRRVIAKPTGLKTLVNQLIADVNLEVFYDPKQSNYITLRPLDRIDDTSLPSIDQTVIEKHSIEIDYDKRISTLLSYYGNINPLQEDKPDNYYGHLFYVDNEVNRTRHHLKPVLKTRFNNWMGPELLNQLTQRSKVITSQYNNIMRRIKFTVPSTSIPQIIIGNVYKIYIPEFTNVYGETSFVTDNTFAPTGGPYKILEVKPNGVKLDVIAEYFKPDAVDTTERYVTIPASIGPSDTRLYGYNLRAAHDALYGTAPTIGQTIFYSMENSNWWISNPLNSGSYACESGTWPVGVNIVLDGVKIIGKAGRGYSHFGLTAQLNAPGGNGGGGLRTTVPITIKDVTIKAGCGGGGTNKYDASTPFGVMQVFQNGGWGWGGWYNSGTVPIIIELINAETNPYSNISASDLPDYFSKPYGGTWVGSTANDGQNAVYHSEDVTNPGYPHTPELGGNAGVAIDGDAFITYAYSNNIVGDVI